jgi:DNA-binding transcriptional LysR family regulator
MDLQRVDLNLMVAFEALMAERSVSAAALRLGISQPAMSGSLARLRSLFADSLFVRAGNTMLPTTRAMALAEPVGRALAALRAAVQPPGGFDPATASRTFRISGGDYAATVLLPALTASLRTSASGVDLRFRFIEKDQVLGLLDAGVLDLAIGVFPDIPKRFAARALFQERFVCVAARGHPALARGLTLNTFAALPHVLVTERGDAVGAVDEALRARGLERRVALTIPYVLPLRELLPGSDLVATVGARVGRILATSGLALHEPPLPLAPWPLCMAWSRQQDADPGLSWLRALLFSVCPAEVAATDVGAAPHQVRS